MRDSINIDQKLAETLRQSSFACGLAAQVATNLPSLAATRVRLGRVYLPRLALGLGCLLTRTLRGVRCAGIWHPQLPVHSYLAWLDF